MVPPQQRPLHSQGAGFPPAGSFYVVATTVLAARGGEQSEECDGSSSTSLDLVERLRGRLASAVAQGVALGARLSGRGAGTALSGRAALAIEPHILEQAGRRLTTLLVTGTNGKSTTTALAAALASEPTVSNRGANLPFGIAGALARGDPHARLGVFEVDEAYVPAVAAALKPAVLVWLNLSRDQLDRALEVRRLAQRIAESAPHVDVVVANAADPVVVAGALHFRRQLWVRPRETWTRDASACPRCGEAIDVEGGSWRCGACGLAEPPASWWIGDDGEAHGPEGRVSLRGAPPGSFNAFNALCAGVAVATVEGRSVSSVLARLEGARLDLEGRFSTWRLTRLRGAPRVSTVLAKNPAGVDALVELLEAWRGGMVAVLNDRVADGRDPSWIWDAPWERLQPRSIVVGGTRAADLALRLEVAGHEPVDARSIGEAVELASAHGPVIVVANYTAFWDVQRSLARLGAVIDRTAPGSWPTERVALGATRR